MKKVLVLVILTFVMLLTSCGTKHTKRNVGDTWDIQISDEYSITCTFNEITDERLVITLKKKSVDDTYNFAIKGGVPCDYILVNEERIHLESAGVLPISYYDIVDFEDEIEVIFPFRSDTDTLKKIDVKAYDTFWSQGDRRFIGVRIILYKS